MLRRRLLPVKLVLYNHRAFLAEFRCVRVCVFAYAHLKSYLMQHLLCYTSPNHVVIVLPLIMPTLAVCPSVRPTDLVCTWQSSLPLSSWCCCLLVIVTTLAVAANVVVVVGFRIWPVKTKKQLSRNSSLLCIALLALWLVWLFWVVVLCFCCCFWFSLFEV